MRVKPILLALLAFLASAASPTAQRPQPTFLGVVDATGLLTPIAVYDGSEWWNPWPWGAESEEIRNLPVPRSLASIPEDWLPPRVKFPATWTAVRGSGRLVSFRALRPWRRAEFDPMDTIVIRTTYRAVGREPVMAISGPGVLADVEAPTPAEHDAVLRQLLPRIAAIEAGEIARWKKDAIAGGAEDEFAIKEVERVADASGVTTIVDVPPRDQLREYGLTKAGTVDGRAYYDLHGEKLFMARPGDDCKIYLSTDGRVVVGPRGDVVSETLAASAYDGFCGDAPEQSIHLAAITIGHRMWWIDRTDLEDGYDYSLLDPLTGEQVDVKGLWGLRR